jgi:malyl-CoA/(S)-citramalyl-CoA lyase
MSLTSIPARSTRINRSELAVPATTARFLENAARSDADVVFLDLEDSVPLPDKERARRRVIEALHDLDWSGKSVSVRINALDTPFMYRDVVDVLEQAGAKLDLLMIPKVGTASDVYAVDALVSGIEMAKGFPRRIGFELIIETALGMQNVDSIAAASPRVESVHFGVADYAASTQARTVKIGGANPHYHVLTDPDEQGRRGIHWGDMWHFAIARLVMAARAAGVRPIDGPFGDVSDVSGFESQAQRSAALGCEGKWAIHPSQVASANRIFSPCAAELQQAHRILEALRVARTEGRGAVALDGKMIDLASVRQAEVLVQKAGAIAARGVERAKAS